MAGASRVCCPGSEDEQFWAENVKIIDEAPSQPTAEWIDQWWAQWWAGLNADGWSLPQLAAFEVSVKRSSEG